MNLDPNIQKLISLLLKKWKLLIIFALIGAMMAFVYTLNFTSLKYSSNVTFFAYAVDSQQELFESQSTNTKISSNTSKMNYAIKMLSTYIEIFKTYEFNQTVANEINKKNNTSYSASQIKNAITFSTTEETAVFRATVTTDNPDLSYQIARQLEESIPEKCKNMNNGLVNASVEDVALKSASQSPSYSKNCIIGLVVGILIAAAYVILRDLIDIRVKGVTDLEENYDIPVLGAIPEFQLKAHISQPKSLKEEKATKGAAENE